MTQVGTDRSNQRGRATASLTWGPGHSCPRCPGCQRETCACPGCRRWVSGGRSSDTVWPRGVGSPAGTGWRWRWILNNIWWYSTESQNQNVLDNINTLSHMWFSLERCVQDSVSELLLKNSLSHRPHCPVFTWVAVQAVGSPVSDRL